MACTSRCYCRQLLASYATFMQPHPMLPCPALLPGTAVPTCALQMGHARAAPLASRCSEQSAHTARWPHGMNTCAHGRQRARRWLQVLHATGSHPRGADGTDSQPPQQGNRLGAGPAGRKPPRQEDQMAPSSPVNLLAPCKQRTPVAHSTADWEGCRCHTGAGAPAARWVWGEALHGQGATY